MKKLFISLIILVFSVALTGCGGGDSETAPTSSQPKTNKATINKAEFDQIKSGMTYEEVKAIIGGEGEVLSESGNPGEQLHTVMYSYEGEGDLGANANFMFQGDKLQNKAQMGLK